MWHMFTNKDVFYTLFYSLIIRSTWPCNVVQLHKMEDWIKYTKACRTCLLNYDFSLVLNSYAGRPCCNPRWRSIFGYLNKIRNEKLKISLFLIYSWLYCSLNELCLVENAACDAIEQRINVFMSHNTDIQLISYRCGFGRWHTFIFQNYSSLSTGYVPKSFLIAVIKALIKKNLTSALAVQYQTSPLSPRS